MTIPDPDQPPPERDWDAEWKAIEADLTPPRRTYLRSDLPEIGGGQGPRDYSPPEIDEDTYVPELEQRSARRPATVIAWAAIAAGPLMMIAAVLLFDQAPSWYVALTLTIFVTGCVLGFFRLPRNREPDSTDGAQV